MRGFFGFGGSAEDRRVRALRKAAPGPLRDYLEVPFPADDTPVDELRLLAIDLETTGLDPRRDHALSVGFVPVDGLTVDLSAARHLVLQVPAEVGQSATVHGLTDDVVAERGVPPILALGEVLAALSGRVLLAHYARIETGFLAASCERVWGGSAPCAVVDTMEVQRRLTTAWNAEPAAGSLRLWAARARWGLPAYKAHDALVDAISCAELYLAQVAHMHEAGPVTLARLR